MELNTEPTYNRPTNTINIFDKGKRQFSGERKDFQTNSAKTNVYPYAKKLIQTQT